MYTVSVQKHFTAFHYLVGGDWGAENERHPHNYLLELKLKGRSLDEHQYLVDIVDINQQLEEVLDLYRGQTLNDLPLFSNYNPSIERFSRILCESLSSKIDAENVCTVVVKLWENQEAWASYRLER